MNKTPVRRQPRTKGYLCPTCQAPTFVACTRVLSSQVIRRYRECPQCEYTVVTVERPETRKGRLGELTDMPMPTLSIAERNRLFETVAPMVWRLCHRAAAPYPWMDAEDLFNSAAVHILKQIHHYDPTRAKLTTFIHTVTQRILADRIRSEFQRRRMFVPTDFADSTPPADPADPFRDVEGRDESAIVRVAVDQLPPADRVLISRRFGMNEPGQPGPPAEPMTLNQIGAVHGVSGSAIRQREGRILRTLAGMLVG